MRVRTSAAYAFCVGLVVGVCIVALTALIMHITPGGDPARAGFMPFGTIFVAWLLGRQNGRLVPTLVGSGIGHTVVAVAIMVLVAK